MNHLFIKEIKYKPPVSLVEAGYVLEKQANANLINIISWPEFPYLPKVSFRIGHIRKEIWLKFYVTEKFIRARETKTNGQVYKDSCVEFFISLDKLNYYNFEFSCIGTAHLAYGKGRSKREFVPPRIVEEIEIQSSLGNLPFEERAGEFEWEMMVRIPLKCFTFNKLESFSGIKAKANFQKCGDETSELHYVTWNPIITEKPDYHRPEFFGDVFFE